MFIHLIFHSSILFAVPKHLVALSQVSKKIQTFCLALCFTKQFTVLRTLALGSVWTWLELKTSTKSPRESLGICELLCKEDPFPCNAMGFVRFVCVHCSHTFNLFYMCIVLFVYVCVVLNWESKSRWIFFSCVCEIELYSICWYPYVVGVFFGREVISFALFHLSIFLLFFFLLLSVCHRLCLDGKFSWMIMMDKKKTLFSSHRYPVMDICRRRNSASICIWQIIVQMNVTREAKIIETESECDLKTSNKYTPHSIHRANQINNTNFFLLFF